MNFYGGTGEASHKHMVKAPGQKTQRKVSKFATQTASQYYNMLIIQKASNCIGRQAVPHGVHEMVFDNVDDDVTFECKGKYSFGMSATGDVTNYKIRKNKKAHRRFEVSKDFARVLQRELVPSGRASLSAMKKKFIGYICVTIKNTSDDDNGTLFNAHPDLHGAPWYNWANVQFLMCGGNEEEEERIKHYPSKFLGFFELDGDKLAMVHCSATPVEWSLVKHDFFVRFKLPDDFADGCRYVPMSSIVHPICVINDYGCQNGDGYIVIVPKRKLGKIFQ